MRLPIIVFAAMLAFATGASAQQLGPHFTYGMTEAEVREASPGVTWQAQIRAANGSVLLSTDFVTIGSQQYMRAVELEDGRVGVVRYGRPLIVDNRAGCTAAAAQTVTDLEREGALNGVRAPWEPTGEVEVSRAGSGSDLRSYEPDADGEAIDFANRRGPVLVEVQGSFAMRPMPGGGPTVPGCIISIRYAPDPFVPTPAPANAPSAAELEAAEIITGARFVEQPDANDYGEHYPSFAMEQGVEARVTLNCIIDADGRLRCIVENEEPLGLGFGAATLRIARLFRVAPEAEGGAPTVGRRIRRTIVFRLAD